MKSLLSGCQMIKSCLQCGSHGFDPWVREIYWRREWLPTPVFLPGKLHGQRTLADYSPLDHKELDTDTFPSLLYYLQPSSVSPKDPLAFKDILFCGPSSWCRIPWLGISMCGSDFSFLWEKLCNCKYLPICGSPTWKYDLEYTASPLFLSVLFWFLLDIFCFRKFFFLLLFRPFSSVVAL